MYKVFYINFGYFAESTFFDIEEAVSYGQSKGFEFSIMQDNNVMYSWSPIRGSYF